MVTAHWRPARCPGCAASPVREMLCRVTARSWTGPTRGRAEIIAAAGAYLLLALVVTWPWVLDPTDVVYGSVGGDQTASIAIYQQLADDHQPPFLPGTLHALNAPEGLSVPWAVSLAGFGSALTLWVLSLAVGSIAAHGVLAVIGYGGSAFAMFLLVRRFTRHAGIAFVVGVAFGFWTFTYTAGWTWPNYIHGWVFVLLAWRMLVVAEQPSTRNGLLAGVAAVVAMTWIQYYLLIAAVAFATMAAAALLLSRRRGDLAAQFRAQLIAGGGVLVAAGVIAGLGAAADFKGAPVREIGDAYVNSARPLMYVIPGPHHPLLGGSAGDWIVDRYPLNRADPAATATYQEIYLGIPLLLLAALGAFLLVRGRTGRLAPMGIAAISLVVVGLLFSAPPTVSVAGVSIPMPYAVVNEVTSVFRVASRFSMLVMLGLCGLAAIALVGLLASKRALTQLSVLALVFAVVAVDGWARPEDSTDVVSHAPIYDVLARQPPGIVAEYPLANAGYVQNYEALLQRFHGHPLFSGWDDGSLSAVRKLALRDLSDPRTPGMLRAYSVRYVLDHSRDSISFPGVVPPVRVRPGLRRIARARGGTLYRVVAQAPRIIAAAGDGFLPPDGPGSGVHWTGEPDATFRILGRCAPCVGTVSFGSGTFARVRDLQIKEQSGRVLLRKTIGSAIVPVRFRVRFNGRLTLRFATDPPPERIDGVLHNGDSRSFGVFVGLPVRFAPDRRAGHRWIDGG